MAKEPSDRYVSAGDFARDASAALRGLRSTKPPTIVGTGEAAPRAAATEPTELAAPPEVEQPTTVEAPSAEASSLAAAEQAAQTKRATAGGAAAFAAASAPAHEASAAPSRAHQSTVVTPSTPSSRRRAQRPRWSRQDGRTRRPGRSVDGATSGLGRWPRGRIWGTIPQALPARRAGRARAAWRGGRSRRRDLWRLLDANGPAVHGRGATGAEDRVPPTAGGPPPWW